MYKDRLRVGLHHDLMATAASPPLGGTHQKAPPERVGSVCSERADRRRVSNFSPGQIDGDRFTLIIAGIFLPTQRPALLPIARSFVGKIRLRGRRRQGRAKSR
jgi:hypothetical protein